MQGEVDLSVEKIRSDIRLFQLLPPHRQTTFWRGTMALVDKLTGVSKLNQLYQSRQFAGLDKQSFTTKLLTELGVEPQGKSQLLAKIPSKGRFILVCNHPYGMIEGVILANWLTEHRSDTKIMANIGLSLFKEIQDYFIFANPLKPKDKLNHSAISQCFEHLEQDGLLVIFPAGRVSFYQHEYQGIADGNWNRLAISLATKTQSSILPVYINGTNSQLFHRLGRIYYRFRLLMLARELLKLSGKLISFHAGNFVTHQQLQQFETTEQANDWLRVNCYLQEPKYHTAWQQENHKQTLKPLAEPQLGAEMAKEISQLPEQQKLASFKQFTVYCGYQAQLPTVVKEIARLRELTFRTLDEGSGEPQDTDHFDASYLHLFIFDNQQQQIIGAYRLGQTDKLLAQANGDTSALYLSQMFDFKADFINQTEPCLEMGRSFIVPEHQQSFYGLLLLWKGIATFVYRNPQYKTLYGTVSLSKVYQPLSVALMQAVMTKPSNQVSAKAEFSYHLPPEFIHYHQQYNLSIDALAELVNQVEPDDKDIPVLLRQYHKLNARFYTVGIDQNFNQTPGMLLSVDLTQMPDKLLALYMGKTEAKQFLANSKNNHKS